MAFRLNRNIVHFTSEHHVGAIHALENNYFLSKEQHLFSLSLIERIQTLYDGAVEYAERNKLDRSLVLPGNEWADIVPISGIKFRTAYNDINYLRLAAPFSGYHMPILDRVDVPQFHARWTDNFLKTLAQHGIPTDIAEQTRALYDPADRLKKVVPEYVEHIKNVPTRYVVRTPRLFGEVGIEVDGLLANPDVILCQSRINGLLSSGVLDKLDSDIGRQGRARVLEIGPGHGSLAYALKTIFGHQLEYICVDLPSSLYHSAVYLSILSNGNGCHILLPEEHAPKHFNYIFVANYMLNEIVGSLGPIDLALNAMSFPEMSVPQVRHYGEQIKTLLGDNGVMFEENAVIKSHHTDVKAIFSEIFPYRKHVESSVIKTKNWCQDVWSNQYIGRIHDCSDAMFWK